MIRKQVLVLPTFNEVEEEHINPYALRYPSSFYCNSRSYTTRECVCINSYTENYISVYIEDLDSNFVKSFLEDF